jgi:predicted MPP superfamily phosphohydrolase
MGLLRWLVVCAAASLSRHSRAAAYAQLRFDANSRFKVVQLTDLHLGESRAADASTLKAVRAVLIKEANAQLVVLSGDMVSGFKNTYSRKGWFAEQCEPNADRIVF